MSNMAEVITETIQKNLGRLSWNCAGCPKISECEEQAAIGERSWESRYCWSIIKAAINEQPTFIMPFPI